MRTGVILALATALGVCLPQPVVAQQQVQAFATWSPAAPFTSPATPVRFGHPSDYRWEGLAIGSIAVGVLGAATYYGLCLDSETEGRCARYVIPGAVIGAVPGAVVGGLIGGLIPKEPRPPPTPQ